ncbi:MAG: hypothetical protein ABIG40_01370 [Parcubacteria group bacterium]
MKLVTEVKKVLPETESGCRFWQGSISSENGEALLTWYIKPEDNIGPFLEGLRDCGASRFPQETLDDLCKKFRAAAK